MRRADRLFQIIDLLRRGDVVTARQLARTLEVSERTVYRDVRDLMASGVPIEGEAGTGYVLEGFDLPPLVFDRDEIEALTFGMRMVQSWGDTELAAAARSALAKVESALPDDRQPLVAGTPLFAPGGGPPTLSFDVAVLRQAIRERRRVHMEYRDGQEADTARTVRPLGMAFFGQVWFLMAWCELREDFRTFRPDRIQDLAVLPGSYEQEPGRRLEDFLARRRREADTC